jgi:hypothetical protein
VQNQPEGFSNQQIMTANIEVMRSLITLLIGKRILSDAEVLLMASFAKERCEKHYPQQIGIRASSFVDILLRALFPSSSNPA